VAPLTLCGFKCSAVARGRAREGLDDEDTTPFHLEACRGNAEVVRLLLDHVADADTEEMKERLNCL